MYENLRVELYRKRISYKKLGKLLNLCENSVYNKINGKTPFFLEEAIKIHGSYFPEFSFLELFKKN